MSIIILIPALICIYALTRGTTQKAFLNVFLPVFMLCPIYFFWKVTALPPIDVSEAILLPLGISMLLRDRQRWRPSLMDLWMALFLFTSWYADRDFGRATTSTFDLFAALLIAFTPYAAGKLLIEQPHARIATLKRIIFLLFVASIIGAYEYRMGQNPFTLIWARFFPDEFFGWKTQIRWGWGRVSGPYGQSELAGLILIFGFVLSLYLNSLNVWEPKFKRLKWLPGKKAAIITWLVGLTLLMTQARGPWLGCLLALPIAFIGRSKNTRRTILIVLALLFVAAPITYSGFKSYMAQAQNSDAEDQHSAVYRTQLLDSYEPLAIQGGAFGWGSEFPHVMGFDSIDNEYLFIALTQGWIGLLAFILMAATALYNCLQVALHAPTRPDRYFGWSMLGVLAGFLFTTFTVFLGNQPYELFFLLAGWSEAMRGHHKQNLAPAESAEPIAEPKQKFSFAQIYT